MRSTATPPTSPSSAGTPPATTSSPGRVAHTQAARRRDAAAAVKRAPSSFQVSSHEAFLEKLDAELAKCDDFAHREVVKVKRELAELESGGSRPRSGSLDGDPEEVEGWRVDAVGQHFLEVEKYVNVNVTAVRKMLRKHDAVLPQRPIAAFYTARMHDMRWVQTDYSSVLVRLSRLYESKTQAAPPATERQRRARRGAAGRGRAKPRR